MAGRLAGGKLSLKRRRDDHGGVPGTFCTKTSWFENQELSDAETSWATLLRAVDPHLNQSSFQKVVNFPDFHPKNPQTENPQPCLEMFNCGVKTFEWVPFPVYCRDRKAVDLGKRPNSTPGKNIPADVADKSHFLGP
ncbi:Fanconi anemia core complex-associated protein 20 isoform X1 [Erythrolamprus reginae]|uniref:Fanconi anemia core complex-associated protein 20 isoform X1 n=1 Tax=Erythrolamprus reginae TaxID=121349 RepID=UPI00396C76A5